MTIRLLTPKSGQPFSIAGGQWSDLGAFWLGSVGKEKVGNWRVVGGGELGGVWSCYRLKDDDGSSLFQLRLDN